jgi:tetratricopeptide (TPR) repeat protein
VSSLGQLFLEMKTEEGNRKATQLFDSTIETLRARGNEAELRSTIGDVYRKVGNKVEARASYDLALALYRTKEFGSYRHTEVLSKIGALEIEGRQQTSLGDFYLSQADSARQAGDVAAQALAFELAGGYYRKSNEVQKALGYFEQSQALYQTAGLKPRQVSVLRTLAGMYETKGDKQKARDLRRQADQLDPPPTSNP